jgi:hypothetical protein
MGLFDPSTWRFGSYFDYLSDELIKVFEKFKQLKYIEDDEEYKRLAEDILKDIDRLLIGCGEDGIDIEVKERTREEIYERVRKEIKNMISILKKIGYLYFGERKKSSFINQSNAGSDIFD